MTLSQGDLLVALGAAKTWRDDEPFAKRPLDGISYVASLLDAHELAIDAADQALQMDGRVDSTLEMNGLFSLLSSDRLLRDGDRAEIERIGQLLRRIIDQGGAPSYHAMANLGLWHYRFGQPDDGRAAYKVAIDAARKVATAESAAMASVFAAREALLAMHPEAAADLKFASDLVAKSNSKAGEFYIRKLNALAQSPADAASILAPQAASRFLTDRGSGTAAGDSKMSEDYVFAPGARRDWHR